jgi:predicted anti-sigma-YlaC factor YlaD
MSTEVAGRTATREQRSSPRIVAALGGAFLLGSGLWAMVAPESFFEAAATFEPFNAHLLRDAGAFMVGLGAVLLLAAAKPAAEALAVTLCGVGIGGVAHTISHVVDRDHGGTPAVDVPVWAVLSLVFRPFSMKVGHAARARA